MQRCSRHPGGVRWRCPRARRGAVGLGGCRGGAGVGVAPQGPPPLHAGGAGRGGRLSCLQSPLPPPPRPPLALISVQTQRLRSITSCSCPSRGRGGAAPPPGPPPTPGTPPDKGRGVGGPRGNGGAPAWRTPEVEAERPRRCPPGRSEEGGGGEVSGGHGAPSSPPPEKGHPCPRVHPSRTVSPPPPPLSPCPSPSHNVPPPRSLCPPPRPPPVGRPQAGKVWQGRGSPGRPRGPSARTGIPEGGGAAPPPPLLPGGLRRL